jgi:hypothetical protein
MQFSHRVILGFITAVGMLLVAGSSQAACSGGACPLVEGVVRSEIAGAFPIPASAIFLGPQSEGQANYTNPVKGFIRDDGNQTVVAGSTAPFSLMIGAGILNAPRVQFNLGLFSATPVVFSIGTNVPYKFPVAPATFKEQGRVGPKDVNWCRVPGGLPPSGTAVGGFDPNCLGPGTTFSGGPPLVHGIIKYRGTATQFGGEAHYTTLASGDAQLAINLGAVTSLPCGPCLIGIQEIQVESTANPVGGAWSNVVSKVAPVLGVPGRFIGSVNPSGLVTNIIAPTSAGNSSPSGGNTTWGAPWTTGRIEFSNVTISPPVIFTITGSDQRNVSGDGVVSLVSGAIGVRVPSGPDLTRAWLQLTVPEPSMVLGLAASTGMLGLLARRRRRQS